MSDVRSLITMNIHFLLQGKALLQQITDNQFRFTQSSYLSSSAGKHMRHVLDHYISFINGWETKIDYDARKRDERMEQEREYTIEHIQKCIDELKKIAKTSGLCSDSIMVQSNNVGDSGCWSRSSVKRELQFLIGHTVHHYALVDFILRVQDFSPPEGFGIAPSTLKHEQKAQTS